MRRSALGEITIRGTVDGLYAELSDFVGCAEWLPGIESAQILAGEGDVSILEVSLQRHTLVVEIVASPPRRISFQQVDRAPGRGVSGGWEMTQVEPGAVRLEAHVQVKSSLRDFKAGRRLRTSLTHALAVVEERCGRRATASLPWDSRKILEVVQRGASLEVRIGDEVVEIE